MNAEPLAVQDKLASLVVEWIENDPLFSSGYTRRRKSLGAKLLALESLVGAFPRLADETLLYRGFNLKKGMVEPNGSISIVPRESDLLESWSSDASWAFEHAAQFENGAVLRRRAGDLDVFLDIDALASAIGESFGNEGELLVRPTTMAIPKADWVWAEEDFTVVDAVPVASPSL